MAAVGGAAHGFVPDLGAWEPWTPDLLARRLAGLRLPWYVAGGWALDLFLGGGYRSHEDLEIGVPAARFGEVAAALPDLDFFVVGDGLVWPLPGSDGMLDVHHQTWGRERCTGRWRLDVFREPAAGGSWVCRRDHGIALPYERLILRTSDGIPFARPEVVLLFKAKANREKDRIDLAAVLPLLDPEAVRWLTDALTRVHPDHTWLAALR